MVAVVVKWTSVRPCQRPQAVEQAVRGPRPHMLLVPLRGCLVNAHHRAAGPDLLVLWVLWAVLWDASGGLAAVFGASFGTLTHTLSTCLGCFSPDVIVTRVH